MDGSLFKLLYVFQYVVLPEAAFTNHPELVQELEGPRTLLPLFHFRSRAMVSCIQSGLIDPDETQSDAQIEAEFALFQALSIDSHRRDGFTVHVVTMPKPEVPPQAYFVAIVYKDNEPKVYGRPSPSTRYFALEHSQAALPMLCEVREDGSRRNFGEGPAADLKAFVDAVFDRITAGQPGNNRVLLDEGSAILMMFAPPSSTDYHLVCVEFEDGSQLNDAKVYRRCELELPPEFVGKKIEMLAFNAQQP